MATSTPITITRGAVNLVIGALGQPGWTKSTLSLYRAGKLLDQLETQFDGDAAPSDKDPAAIKAWSVTAHTLGWTPKDIDTVKECIKHHVKEGHIPPSKHYVSVADALGLEDDSEEK